MYPFRGFCKLVTLPQKCYLKIDSSTFKKKGLSAASEITDKDKCRDKKNKSPNENVQRHYERDRRDRQRCRKRRNEHVHIFGFSRINLLCTFLEEDKYFVHR